MSLTATRTDVAPVTLEDIRESSDGKWLIAQLRQSLEMSVEHVLRIAAIVRRLEELEIPVTIKFAPLPFLRKIAYGNMSPELYVRYEGDSLLLGKIGSLPTPDQDRLAQPNATVKVMSLNNDHRMVPVESLTRGEIAQVFATGRIRSDAEQVGFLREKLQATLAGPELPDTNATVRVSKKRRGISVTGPTFISLIEMRHYCDAITKTAKRT